MLYALGVGLGHDPMNEDELAFVYEKNLKVLPTMATVLGAQRLAGAQPGQRHRLGDGGQRRAGLYAGAAARRRGRADRANADRRSDRQGRGQGRAAFDRAQDHRQGHRRADRHRHADDLLPRRWRLRRSAAAVAAAASAPVARAGCGLRFRHASGNGADLSPERRLQSVARRARRGKGRGFRRGRSCTGSARSACPATRC